MIAKIKKKENIHIYMYVGIKMRTWKMSVKFFYTRWFVWPDYKLEVITSKAKLFYRGVLWSKKRKRELRRFLGEGKRNNESIVSRLKAVFKREKEKFRSREKRERIVRRIIKQSNLCYLPDFFQLLKLKGNGRGTSFVLR